MYAVMEVYSLLFGKECALSRIPHRQQADEFIAFGGIHYLLDLLGFFSDRNVKDCAKTFVGSGKYHVFESAPCRCEIIERALLHGMK